MPLLLKGRADAGVRQAVRYAGRYALSGWRRGDRRGERRRSVRPCVWPPQVSVHRAAEGVEDAVLEWRRERWSTLKDGLLPRGVDNVRGRGRAGPAAAEGTYEVPARPDPGDRVTGSEVGHVLLQVPPWRCGRRTPVRSGHAPDFAALLIAAHRQPGLLQTGLGADVVADKYDRGRTGEKKSFRTAGPSWTASLPRPASPSNRRNPSPWPYNLSVSRADRTSRTTGHSHNQGLVEPITS